MDGSEGRYMNAIRRSAFLLGVGVVGALGIATTACQNPGAAVQEETILTLTEEVGAAWRSLDADDYLSWFSGDLLFYFEGQRVDRDAFDTVIRASLGGLRSSTFEVLDPRVQVLGQDAATISFDLRELMVDTAGGTTDLQAATTFVWARRPDGWKVVLAHESF